MLACPSSSLHGLATLQRHSQPSHFLLSNSLFFPPSPRLAASRKCNFRSLLSGRSSRRSAVRASADSPEVSESVVSDSGVLQPYSVKIPVGDRHILVETGHIGRQASGSVTVTDGETIVYTTVCLDDVPSEPSDFFPLSVHYQERFSAAGRTSGGFFKREGKTRDHEVLICRLIDRPLRPTMPKGFYHETQILSWVGIQVGGPSSLLDSNLMDLQMLHKLFKDQINAMGNTWGSMQRLLFLHQNSLGTCSNLQHYY